MSDKLIKDLDVLQRNVDTDTLVRKRLIPWINKLAEVVKAGETGGAGIQELKQFIRQEIHKQLELAKSKLVDVLHENIQKNIKLLDDALDSKIKHKIKGEPQEIDLSDYVKKETIAQLKAELDKEHEINQKQFKQLVELRNVDSGSDKEIINMFEEKIKELRANINKNIGAPLKEMMEWKKETVNKLPKQIKQLVEQSVILALTNRNSETVKRMDDGSLQLVDTNPIKIGKDEEKEEQDGS